MPVFPQMNLAPEATPWGREVQRRLEAAETNIAAAEAKILVLQKTVDLALGRLTQL